MRRKQQADRLLRKYRKGQCTEEEKQLLFDWYDTWHQEDLPISEVDIDLAEQEMWQTIQKRPTKRIRKKPHFKWMAAAGIVFAVIFFTYQYVTRPIESVESRLLVHDVNPGGDRASLRLADGSMIDLSNIPLGQSIDQDGYRIVKKADGEIIYTPKRQPTVKQESKTPAYHEIHTPKGGQFQLKLPDGTKVWLNAASFIRYPLAFDAHERRVELVGEAYFEVEKQHKQGQPFVVQTNLQEIYVLGTHFNVNAYENEPAIRTTLLEGKVKVLAKEGAPAVLLKPNEQSVLARNGSQVSVQRVDPMESIAWKEGDFVFDNADLKTIMRQLERWYNVQAIDLENFPNNTYNGKMKRSAKLSKVLRILELTSALKFKIEAGNTTDDIKKIQLIK